MSSATDLFFEIIQPKFSEKGFKFLKSKRTFIKKHQNKTFEIFIKFDGRGGLTILDWVDLKIIKENGDLETFDTFRMFYSEGDVLKLRIPVMYSQKALDLANDMNLRGLGKLDFEEKYPKERIESSAEKFLVLAENSIFTFFEKCS